jgi:spermidine/putrescine transport system permease protein
MLAFTLSLDDFVVSFFTGGAGSTTLPVWIYSSVKRGISPEINALSTLLIVTAVIATVIVTLIQKSPTLPMESELPARNVE